MNMFVSILNPSMYCIVCLYVEFSFKKQQKDNKFLKPKFDYVFLQNDSKDYENRRNMQIKIEWHRMKITEIKKKTELKNHSSKELWDKCFFFKFAFYMPIFIASLANAIFMTFNCMHLIRSLSVYFCIFISLWTLALNNGLCGWDKVVFASRYLFLYMIFPCKGCFFLQIFIFILK